MKPRADRSRVRAARLRAAGDVSNAVLNCDGYGDSDRASRARLELVGRLWRPIFLRTRRLLRHRRLCDAILQARYGVNAWLGLFIAIAAAAWLGAAIGSLSFRSGLRGSYFALVTLAFAEVLRILASVAPSPAPARHADQARPLPRPSSSRAARHSLDHPRLVALSMAVVRMVETAGSAPISSRYARTRMPQGRLASIPPGQARCDDAFGRHYRSRRRFLCAVFSVPRCRYRLWTWISIEALLAPIIGGIGTVLGPLLGALVVQSLGESTKLITGDAPGLDLVIYGCVLIVVVAFAPRGIAGLLAKLDRRLRADRQTTV